ncbi:hypothetical protein Ciccas_003122 [Cichlidogyrus casuarinus]|uniref:ADP-dependent glucokinase n=1 Tax=Cichlidogyrus casuarinus TaxID=1844966 RepID=A0ABD2QFA1_9PLAT
MNFSIQIKWTLLPAIHMSTLGIRIIDSFYKIESLSQPKPVSKPGPLVLVGFGGCMDVAVPALSFLSGLNIEPPPSLQSSPAPDQLETMNDITVLFSHSFSKGAAFERTVKNKKLFLQLVEAANSGKHTKDKSVYIGGNAPVMANRLAKEGLQVALAGRLSNKMKSLMHPHVKVLQAPPDFGLTDPPTSDIHLVLEFEKGETWGNYTAPRANRLILIRDQENPMISGLWPELMQSYEKIHFDLSNRKHNQPDLFIVGGLQTMSSFLADDGPDIREQRLQALNDFLINKVPPRTLVHFESASFDDAGLAGNIAKLILPYTDSIGLNEQELPSLIELLKYGKVPLNPNQSIPRVATVLDQIREVWALLTDQDLPRMRFAQRTISRMHLHTLGFQIIIVRRDPKQLDHETRTRLMNEFFGPEGKLKDAMITDLGRGWPKVKAAAAKASLTAYRYTCAEAHVHPDPDRTKILMDDSFSVTADRERWPEAGRYELLKQKLDRVYFNSSNPVQCWYEVEPELPNLEGGTRRNDRRSPNGNTYSNRVKVVQICVSTGLVCEQVQKTAGAGDNISAAALAVQAAVMDN